MFVLFISYKWHPLIALLGTENAKEGRLARSLGVFEKSLLVTVSNRTGGRVNVLCPEHLYPLIFQLSHNTAP